MGPLTHPREPLVDIIDAPATLQTRRAAKHNARQPLRAGKPPPQGEFPATGHLLRAPEAAGEELYSEGAPSRRRRERPLAEPQREESAPTP